MNHNKCIKYIYKMQNIYKNNLFNSPKSNIYHKKILYYLNGGTYETFNKQLSTKYDATKIQVESLLNPDYLNNKYQTFIDSISAYISRIKSEKEKLKITPDQTELISTKIGHFEELLQLVTQAKDILIQKMKNDEESNKNYESIKTKLLQEDTLKKEIMEIVMKQNNLQAKAP
jgi:hypothetical protein